MLVSVMFKVFPKNLYRLFFSIGNISCSILEKNKKNNKTKQKNPKIGRSSECLLLCVIFSVCGHNVLLGYNQFLFFYFFYTLLQNQIVSPTQYARVCVCTQYVWKQLHLFFACARLRKVNSPKTN